MRCALALLVLLVASCGAKDPTLAALEDFTARACACPDQACANALGKELDAWLDKVPMSFNDPPEQRAAQRDKRSRQLNEYENCAQRFDPFYVPWGDNGLKTGHAIGGPTYDISPAMMEAASRKAAADEAAHVDAAVPPTVTELSIAVGGRKTLKTLASCDESMGADRDDCRDLFVAATKCRTASPSDGSDACVAEAIADWLDDHPDAGR